MSTSIQNVILVGGNGTIGSSILSALLVSPFTVTILTRLSSTHPYPPHLKVIKSDYSSASLIAAFTDQDAVVCALGAEGLVEEIKLVDAAAAAGVKRFLPSEYSCNTLNAATRGLVSTFELKGAVLERLRETEVRGMSWTGIATGAAFDWGMNVGLVGFNISNYNALILDGGNTRFSVSNLSQIGAAVVSVLSKLDETVNQFLYVDSFTVTQNEILGMVEKASGKKWEVSHLTTEAAKREGEIRFGKGEFEGLLLLLKVVLLGEEYGADFTRFGLANEKLGLPKHSLEETVKSLFKKKDI